MKYGLGLLASTCLLIALIGGTIHALSALADVGVRYERLDTVHSLSPDHRCADVAGAAAHDGSGMHVCPGGAALLPCQIELTAPRSATVRPEPEVNAGAGLRRPDPQPPKPLSGKL